MKRCIMTVLLCLLSTLLLLSTTFAQEQSGGGNKTPRMTTEDVLGPHAPAPREVEISSAPSKASKPSGVSTRTTGGWIRYSPEDINLSIELPGKPRPFDMPDLSPASGEFSSPRAFVYNDDSLNVFGVHLAVNHPMSADEIKVALSAFMYGLADSGSAHGHQFSFEPIGPSRLSVKVSSKQGGNTLLFQGVAIGKERDLWFVMAGNPGGFKGIQILAKRVLNSIEFF